MTLQELSTDWIRRCNNMDFLNILLEAKTPGSKPTKRKKVIKVDSGVDKKDYTDDVEAQRDEDEDVENQDTGNEGETQETNDNLDDQEVTDYTSEEEEVEPTENSDDNQATQDETDPEEGEGETTDYTDEEGDGGDETNDSEDTGDEGDGSTDYTDGAGDETDDSVNYGSDDTADGSDGTETDADDGSDANDTDKNRLILEDFVSLYYLTKNSISKLTNIDKTDIFVNKIITQVISNLSTLQKQLFEFITCAFSNNKYVNNLYQYNYFLEAFKINVEMLKKISVFISN